MKGSVAFIGAGNMGEALLSGFLDFSGFGKDKIYFYEKDTNRVTFISSKYNVTALKEGGLPTDLSLLFVCTKPGSVLDALKGYSHLLPENALIVSIAAGISLSSLESALPKAHPCARIMPNTPFMVGEGASGISFNPYVTNEQKTLLLDFFKKSGTACELPESLLDAVTGLSGSGPAYVFQFIQAMADGGVLEGLPRKDALLLAARTVLGAAKMVIESNEHPAVLSDKVTSPGGTTARGLFALEEGNMKATVINAVRAATHRSKELSGKN